jgi:hypothetical protein
VIQVQEGQKAGTIVLVEGVHASAPRPQHPQELGLVYLRRLLKEQLDPVGWRESAVPVGLTGFLFHNPHITYRRSSAP